MVIKQEVVDDISIHMEFNEHVTSGFSSPTPDGSPAESHTIPKTEETISRLSTPLIPSLANINSRPNSETPPRKKRRIMIVEVVVPTLRAVLDQVPAKIKGVKEDDKEIMQKLVNPKVKKARNLEFSLDTVRSRLKGIEFYEVPLDRDVRDVVVTRLFMSKVYGGNPQETFPRVAQNFLRMHHMDDFMYLNLDMNPHAPQVPGAPGLFFDADEPIDEFSKIRRVFSRIASAQWEYMGQYEMERVASLTMEEWNEQRSTVRLVWASKLSTTAWGVHCRAVVHLNEQLGRKPTKSEVREALQNGNQFKNVSREQIAEGFLKGWVTMAVWTMKCVGYDVDFQRDLVTEYANWSPPDESKRLATPQRGRKRKREEHRDEDEHDLIYHPRGTKTRPI